MAKNKGTANAGTMEMDSGNAKMEKLTELLNLTGRKLLELKGVLHDEAIETAEFDVATYLPLVDRYRNEIGIVDSIKVSRSTSETSLHSLVSTKRKYHYYLEEVKKVAFDDLNTSSVKSPSKGSDSLDNVGTSVTAACSSYPHKTSMETLSMVSESPSIIHQDTELVREARMHKCFSEIVDKGIKRSEDLTISSICSNSFQSQKGEALDEDESVLNREFCPEHEKDRDKYKVVRKKIRHRNRVHKDNFYASTPIQQNPSKLKSPIPSPKYEMYTPRIMGRVNNNEESVISKEMDMDSIRETLPLINKFKKSGESWYECKERCRAKLLQEERLLQSEPRPRMATSVSFKDYLKTKSSSIITSPSSKSKKSVRFSLSPKSLPQAPTFTTTSCRSSKAEIASKYYSDTSDDDEVGFKDVQFPLRR